ncbi:hypothetical protein BDN72DRAFT_890803 [Pluteus cervinus]|uniref:Uncharacterized protein n=1 Tax=Pluteus cervinus TaxID=181527 RepID=A0ACD3BGK5_9AGAR|nr:hypothetical protein BDN72DRAFT_890803 [Pluteus cervinus]
MSLLTVPPEIRLAIYAFHLHQHKQVRLLQQPTNAHLHLLQTCRLIRAEASPTYSQYISLRTDHQMFQFASHAPSSLTVAAKHVDIACDGRLLVDPFSGQIAPVSHSHLALSRLVGVERLRVFEFFSARPISEFGRSGRFLPRLLLGTERSMFGGNDTLPNLVSYELYQNPSTQARLFSVLPSHHIQELRLSGNIHLPEEVSLPALRHLIIAGVTGNDLDRKGFEPFADASLESFTHVRRTNLDFELREPFLLSMAGLSAASLTSLVLLGCSRVSTEALTACLMQMQILEHFSLSFFITTELEHDFIAAIPNTVMELKLSITYAWYSLDHSAEERQLCNTLEVNILERPVPPRLVYVRLGDRLLAEDSRLDRWQEIARARRCNLSAFDWVEEELARQL